MRFQSIRAGFPMNSPLTLAQLRRIMPAATESRAILFLPYLNAAMEEFEIDTPARQSAFLAQIGHESGSLVYVREIASGANYDDRADLGNTQPEAIDIAISNNTTPGRFWKGRGLIQLTGYFNYCACSEGLFGDSVTLAHNPVLLERKEIACRSAAWFWHSRGLNSLADGDMFIKITRRINGGTNGLADRLAFHARARKELSC